MVWRIRRRFQAPTLFLSLVANPANAMLTLKLPIPTPPPHPPRLANPLNQITGPFLRRYVCYVNIKNS